MTAFHRDAPASRARPWLLALPLALSGVRAGAGAPGDRQLRLAARLLRLVLYLVSLGGLPRTQGLVPPGRLARG